MLFVAISFNRSLNYSLTRLASRLFLESFKVVSLFSYQCSVRTCFENCINCFSIVFFVFIGARNILPSVTQEVNTNIAKVLNWQYSPELYKLSDFLDISLNACFSLKKSF